MEKSIDRSPLHLKAYTGLKSLLFTPEERMLFLQTERQSNGDAESD